VKRSEMMMMMMMMMMMLIDDELAWKRYMDFFGG
jgi:hypothetical protein